MFVVLLPRPDRQSKTTSPLSQPTTNQRYHNALARRQACRAFFSRTSTIHRRGSPPNTMVDQPCAKANGMILDQVSPYNRPAARVDQGSCRTNMGPVSKVQSLKPLTSRKHRRAALQASSAATAVHSVCIKLTRVDYSALKNIDLKRPQSRV